MELIESYCSWCNSRIRPHLELLIQACRAVKIVNMVGKVVARWEQGPFLQILQQDAEALRQLESKFEAFLSKRNALNKPLQVLNLLETEPVVQPPFARVNLHLSRIPPPLLILIIGVSLLISLLTPSTMPPSQKAVTGTDVIASRLFSHKASSHMHNPHLGSVVELLAFRDPES